MSSESGHDIELTTIDDKYKINLSQIYTGSFEIEQAKWSYNHDAQTVTNGTLTLNIGDYINDTETNVEGFDGKWRVLGEENGQLLLTTATYYAPFDGSVGSSTMPLLELSGEDGFNNGISKLNAICAQYADNVKTENGRSIKVEDINIITGYDPMESRLNPTDLSIKGPYGNGTIYQYKNKVTYKLEADGISYIGDKASSGKYTNRTNTYSLKPIGNENDIAIGDTYTIEGTNYKYFPETLGEFPTQALASGQTAEGISQSSIAYDMLFSGNGTPYYLATQSIRLESYGIEWSLFNINPGAGMVLGGSLNNGLWHSEYDNAQPGWAACRCTTCCILKIKHYTYICFKR